MKLTHKQKQHLLALMGGERSTYPGLHAGVLNSLSLKGLVAARHLPGSILMPANNIKWRITGAGRAIIESLKAPA